MFVNTPRFVVAAPSSGSGKSTVTTGLMAALARASVVQGFKVGPDYIDPGYHTAAAGRISRNLDTWMVPIPQVLAGFGRAVAGADIAVAEGVMGLFDGYDAKTERGSTAQIAKLLHAPVVLVIDVGKMARSAGAIALGYRNFDPDLNVAGVICNNVGSEKHAMYVTQAIESIGLPVLGCVPRNAQLRIPERHLGLQTAVERTAEIDAFLQLAGDEIATHIDMEWLWQIAKSAKPFEIDVTEPVTPSTQPPVRLAVARDEAFCFYYEDNFDLLRQAGAELLFFSPLRDAALPENIAGLYLGGGYPELYAAELAANVSMMDTIRQEIEDGLPTYAECGGLMFLTSSITDLENVVHPMIGVVPGRAQMVGKLTMGYRKVTAVTDNLLLPATAKTRGHEFHYSDWVERPDDLPYAYQISPRIGQHVRQEGYAAGNLLASYVHLHFGANPMLAQNFVAACQGRQ